MRLPDGTHLSYCTNIHPGESWVEVLGNLTHYVPTIKAEVAPTQPFGIGLRLSALAATELARPPALGQFKDWLAREQVYVFTLNGFPYGPFAGAPVKAKVYQPDWSTPQRAQYTHVLEELLAALLPPGVDGSISTAPGCFRADVTPSRTTAITHNLIDRAVALWRRQQQGGPNITLALEPEPSCMLETTEEAVVYFRETLLGRVGRERFAAATGVSVQAAEQAIVSHLSLCLDACHAAVEFESPQDCLSQIASCGIQVGKCQVTTGLELVNPTAADIDALSAFDDPIYLHQVVISTASGLTRYVDLPDAVERFRTAPPAGPSTWRVHFHVPVFQHKLGVFTNTQRFATELLARLRTTAATKHLEVETYTWDVLPPRWRSTGVEGAIAREIRWTRDQWSA